MSRSAQEIVEAIITAAELRGADDRGKDGLDGYMLTMARTDTRRFGMLFGWALRLKMKARRGTDDEKPDFLTLDEAKAELRKVGMPERVLDYIPHIDLRTVPADRRKRPQPTSSRVITEAVINAAIRHGRDGRGKDGLLGYMHMLVPVDPQLSAMFLGLTQRWQFRYPPPRPAKQELDPEMQEYCRAVLEECYGSGSDPEHRRDNPYPDPESDDEGLIDATDSEKAGSR